MIKNLTNLSWDAQQIARERGTLRSVKNVRAEMTALLENIVQNLTVRLNLESPFQRR